MLRNMPNLAHSENIGLLAAPTKLAFVVAKVVNFRLIGVRQVRASPFAATSSNDGHQGRNENKGPCQHWGECSTVALLGEFGLQHLVARGEQVPKLIGEAGQRYPDRRERKLIQVC